MPQISVSLILFCSLAIARGNEAEAGMGQTEPQTNLYHFVTRMDQKFEAKFRQLELLSKEFRSEWRASQQSEIANSLAKEQNAESKRTEELKQTVDSFRKEMQNKISNLEESQKSTEANIRRSIENINLESARNLSRSEEEIKSNGETVTDLITKISTIQRQVSSLQANALTVNERQQFHNVTMVLGSLTELHGSLWKTEKLHFYDQNGSTEEIDFTNCSPRPCCKNLGSLYEGYVLIHPLSTCVILHCEQDCGDGCYQTFYPGSTASRADFGSANNMYKSISTCQ